MEEKKAAPTLSRQSVIGNVLEVLGIVIAGLGVAVLFTGGSSAILILTGVLVVIVAELLHIRYLLDRD